MQMTQMKFIHDPVLRILYSFPEEPGIAEEVNKRGRRTGWLVNSKITIIRPDNRLNSGRWKYPTEDNINEWYPAHYEGFQLPSFFRQNCLPHGVEITSSEFDSLRTLYELEQRDI